MNIENSSTGENTAVGTGNGNDAFEAFENGASIEEINEKYFSQNAASDNDINGDGAKVVNPDNSVAFDDSNVSDRQTDTSSDSPADGNAENSDVDTKVFSQGEVDAIVGKRLEKERNKRIALEDDLSGVLNDLSDYLGVEKGNVREALRKEKFKREAHEQGIEDTDVYERARIAESERDDLKRQIDNAEIDRKNKEFADVVLSQIHEFEKNNPGVDIVSVSKSEEFNATLRALYENPATRSRCFEFAFGAHGKAYSDVSEGDKDVKSSPHQSPYGVSRDEQKGSSNHSVGGNASVASADAIRRVNEQRAGEGASSSRSVNVADTKFDYDKMDKADFDAIFERVKNGEVIMP